MTKLNKIKYTEEDLQQLAENILCDINYDIYKEEMVDGFGLIEGIKSKIIGFVKNVEVVYE
jgi:hypothetical protein|tara:strand:- start:45 stop:227 length:183 start_codon:yes stop_codon:yes gene_type:complete